MNSTTMAKMTLLQIPTNYDAIRIIQMHTDDLYLILKDFLSNFADEDRQTLLCMYAELEFEYTKN